MRATFAQAAASHSDAARADARRALEWIEKCLEEAGLRRDEWPTGAAEGTPGRQRAKPLVVIAPLRQ